MKLRKMQSEEVSAGPMETKVVQLGDIIDGCNSKLKQSEKALKTVLDVLSRR